MKDQAEFWKPHSQWSRHRLRRWRRIVTMRFRIPDCLSLVPVRMFEMGFPVGRVCRRQFRRANHEEVLSVILLGVLREVETAGDDRLVVNHHNLVVGDARAWRRSRWGFPRVERNPPNCTSRFVGSCPRSSERPRHAYGHRPGPWQSAPR